MTTLAGLTPALIVDGEQPLYVTNASSEAVRAELLPIGAGKGPTFYEWTPANGMWRLSSPSTLVPGTQAPLSAIGYVATVRSDSIFLMSDMEDALQSRGLQMALLGALTLQDAVPRRVILPLGGHRLPGDLLGIASDLEQLLSPSEPRRHLRVVKNER